MIDKIKNKIQIIFYFIPSYPYQNYALLYFHLPALNDDSSNAKESLLVEAWKRNHPFHFLVSVNRPMNIICSK